MIDGIKRLFGFSQAQAVAESMDAAYKIDAPAPDLKPYLSTISHAEKLDAIEPAEVSGPKIKNSHYMDSVVDICVLCQEIMDDMSQSLKDSLKLHGPRLKELREQGAKIMDDYAETQSKADKIAWAETALKYLAVGYAIYYGISIQDVDPLKANLIYAGAATCVISDAARYYELSSKLQHLKGLSEETKNSLEGMVKCALITTQLASNAVSLPLIWQAGGLAIPSAIENINGIRWVLISFKKISDDSGAQFVRSKMILVEGKSKETRKKIERDIAQVADVLKTQAIITKQFAGIVSDYERIGG